MIANEFGKFLSAARKSAGLTLEELGELIGLSKSYLSNVENGRRGVLDPKMLKKISDHLGVSYSDLMIKAGYNDEQSDMYDKVTFAAQLIVEQILEITEKAKRESNIESHIKIIESFEEDLVAGAKGKNVTIQELKNRLWYLEGDGDSMKSTIGRRSDSREISTLLDVLKNLIDNESSALREKFRKSKEESNLEIENYLKDNFVLYNNHPLTDQDKQRILDMLKTLFPEYSTK